MIILRTVHININIHRLWHVLPTLLHFNYISQKKLKEVKWLSQDYKASKWWRQNYMFRAHVNNYIKKYEVEQDMIECRE